MGVYELVKCRDSWKRLRVKSGENGIQSITTGQNNMLEKIIDLTGSWKWNIKSTIDFKYSVEKVNDIFSKESSALLVSPVQHERSDNSMDTGNCPKVEALRRIVFVDCNVYRIYGTKIHEYFKSHNVAATIISFETTEETKTTKNLLFVLEEIEKFNPDRRREPIIAVGGGVCLDIVGLAATLFRRRTPYIRVPTTLLALVDASVGAKTGVNFMNGKNKLGAYVPPFAVFLDSSFLKTLPPRQLSNGSGEIIKMALVKSGQLFEVLEAYGENLIRSQFQTANADVVIQKAIETMLEELVPNLWEDDLNRLVDFGHVISPVLEMEALPALLHGEAVNIDMTFMCFLSKVMGLLKDEELYRIVNCMKGLGLPVFHTQCTHELIQKSLQTRLKHGNGKLRLPMPSALGRAIIINTIKEEDLKEAFQLWTVMCSSYTQKTC